MKKSLVCAILTRSLAFILPLSGCHKEEDSLMKIEPIDMHAQVTVGLPNGCTPGYLYSPSTGEACVSGNCDDKITFTAMFSVQTPGDRDVFLASSATLSVEGENLFHFLTIGTPRYKTVQSPFVEFFPVDSDTEKTDRGNYKIDSRDRAQFMLRVTIDNAVECQAGQYDMRLHHIVYSFDDVATGYRIYPFPMVFDVAASMN